MSVIHFTSFQFLSLNSEQEKVHEISERKTRNVDLEVIGKLLERIVMCM